MHSISKSRVKEEVTRRLDTALDKLYQIWDKIGIDEQQVGGRAGTVSMHVCNLLDELVSEEKQLCDELDTKIQQSLVQLSALCKELTVPAVQVSDQLSMILRDRELTSKVESLRREKEERMKQLKQLLEQDQALCQALCSTPHYVASHAVPTSQQLEQLEAHIEELQAEKETRHREFLSTKKKMVALCTEMDYQPETSFERDVLSDDDGGFQPTTENMQSLKNTLRDLESLNNRLQQQGQELWGQVHSLWDRLDTTEADRTLFTACHQGHKESVLSGLREEVARCERLKHNSLYRLVELARKELTVWWDCCCISKEQRSAFLPFLAEKYSEQLLEDHERELQKLKDYYKEHQPLLDLMAKRDKLWTKMLEFERKASDPNRFFHDRGGKFLVEEKARKKLMKELPKVEEDLKEEVEAWENANSKAFLIEGVSVNQYIDQQWALFRKEKEHEKEERLKNKTKQMKEEMMFGSKPNSNTPAKRRFVNTPNNTPLKAQKGKENSKTPSSVSRVQHSSLVPSPYTTVARQPLVPTKTPNANHTARRRSVRLARKRLRESMHKSSANSGHNNKKVAAKPKAELFSQTTVSCSDTFDDNPTMATSGSYHDFSKGLSQMARPNCRSSITPAPTAGTIKRV